MYAYAHTSLDEETIKLTGFSSGDKLYAFICGFFGFKGLPNFFTKDILLLAYEKQEMLELIKELHKIVTKRKSQTCT